MTDYITKPGGDFMQLTWLLKYIEGTKGYIAGGVFKNVFNKEKTKDIDVFFENHKDWKEAVKLYTSKADLFEQVYENPRVVAFEEKSSGLRIELVGSKEDDDDELTDMLFNSIEGSLDQFDFTVTKFALFLVGKPDEHQFKVTYHPDFFLHLQTRRLVFDESQGLIRPISTFERTLRYVSYGYGLCRNSKGVLVRAIQEEGEMSDAQLSNSFYDGID